MNNVTPLTSKRGSAARARAGSERTTRIYLVGAIRAIERPGGENILPRSKKTQAVLAYLCLARGERLLRSRVAGLIWDRSTERQARDSLRHALNQLDGMGSWRFETDHETVRLDTTACWIDAFESPGQSDLLLDDLHGVSVSFDQWLVGERVRFERRWQTSLEEELNRLANRSAAPELRAAAARKLLNFVPTHETAVRSLMTAFADMDDGVQAIREYERFRLLINASHGMGPSEKTVGLYEAIRRGSRLRAAPQLNDSQQLADKASTPAARDVNVIGPTASTAPRTQPSIAVLPFRNLSIETGHDYAVEGLTDDLVEALSRVPSLFVTSRLSAAVFKNQDRPPQEIGEALGVRYILSGSMRVIGERLRLIVELTDATSGSVLWSSRFDERFSDLLDVQDRLAETVVRSVAPHVRSAELNRVRIKRPEQQDAYDLFLRAQENMHNPSHAIFETSGALLEQAIARQPHHAAILAWRAHWHVMRVGQGWSPDPAADTEQADYFARRAVECDWAEPLAHAVQGHVAAYLRKDFVAAFACFETALGINPNSARAWLWSAYADAWIGEGASAVEKSNRAMALSPYDPLVCAFSGGAGMAYLADGQYDRAIEFALRCVQANPGYSGAYRVLVTASMLAGREAEARAAAHQLLRLEPRFTVQQFRRRYPGSAWPICETYCDAFARAGVPLSD